MFVRYGKCTISTTTSSGRAIIAAPLRYPLKNDPYSSHGLIAAELRALAQRAREAGGDAPLVVDVGCGSGPLGGLLGGEPIRLFGFDRDESGLAHARVAGYETAHGDLLDGALPVPPAPARALVCADVLEHVPDPAALLPRLLRTYLPTGGTVIISLPNVAHWSVRFGLLLGRWQYADKGILDRTHMRFFTASTAAAFLRDAGVRDVRRRVTSAPLPVLSDLFSPGRALFPIHALSARLTGAWPGLLAYQFVYVGEWSPP